MQNGPRDGGGLEMEPPEGDGDRAEYDGLTAAPDFETAGFQPLSFDESAFDPETLSGGGEPASDSAPASGFTELDEDLSWHLRDEDAPSGEENDEELFTQTLAELYADQGLIDRAVDVYRHLSEERPDDEALRTRLAELEGLPRIDLPASSSLESAVELAEDSQWDSSVGQAPEDEPSGLPRQTVADDEALEALAEDMVTAPEDAADLSTPFAWSTDVEDLPAAETGPLLSDYFADLLAWRPGGPTPTCVPIEDLAPDDAPEAAVGGREELDGGVVPIEDLAPGPDEGPAADRTARFQDWMDRLEK